MQACSYAICAFDWRTLIATNEKQILVIEWKWHIIVAAFCITRTIINIISEYLNFNFLGMLCYIHMFFYSIQKSNTIIYIPTLPPIHCYNVNETPTYIFVSSIVYCVLINHFWWKNVSQPIFHRIVHVRHSSKRYTSQYTPSLHFIYLSINCWFLFYQTGVYSLLTQFTQSIYTQTPRNTLTHDAHTYTHTQLQFKMNLILVLDLQCVVLFVAELFCFPFLGFTLTHTHDSLHTIWISLHTEYSIGKWRWRDT